MASRNRGTKKTSLRDLSRKPLAREDFEKAHGELLGMSDRASALVCATMVETALAQALTSHFPLRDTAHLEQIFWRDDAPLATFASKITIARAIGIYGDNLEKTLNRIRKIRNAFAHSVVPITFEHELVSTECEWLPEGELGIEHTLSPQRERFIAICMGLVKLLGAHAVKFSKIPVEIDLPDALPQS